MDKTEEKRSSKLPSILFFCRDCQKIVPDPKKIGNKYIYKCNLCDGKNVVFGTKKSILNYFRIKESSL
ncbi:MAG: hypothetical protein UV80_C0006G0081 [Candidatus Peregrinibacteria bacterium GW2011_GWF2_43_17]|nr:MAG: hypothetical protein UV80_C0006G0081 [Candidatus Peregrinibacteria bacterium GW2011_GWF2_43_17]HAU40107.1 hypothetical protein [Candidatus Peregrinibacteria bacterium]